MGILEHAVTKVRRSLAARSLVGRAPGSVVRVEDPRVSAEHASVFWSGSQWVDARNAKPFSNLDTAFNVARRVGGSLDLLVLFPANTGQLVIPLEQLN